MAKREGFIDVPGGKVWYEIVGKGQSSPLLILHGGPGYPHDYLEPLEKLSDQREIIFYDQLGCGNSQRPTDTNLWTIERFVKELEEIVKTLKLERYHLLGHSWGSALAVAFALDRPQGLASMILSDPYISTPQWEEDAIMLLKELPEEMQKALKDGNGESEEYKNASKEFYYRFVYRMKLFSPPILRAENKMNSEIYNYMWGPKEFKAIGTLKDFDPTDKLSQINIPVLLLCGRFDEATPQSTQYFQTLFPNAKMKIFENSAHFPHWTDKEDYIATVRDFLGEVE
jgi:proline iminopeptidase